MRARWGFVVIAALVSALGLSACGQQPPGTSGTPPAAAPAFNDVDVTFAQQMIPHHQMAIRMAEMAQEHARAQQVEELAGRIQQVQEQEIQTMTRWLRAWGKPVPATDAGMMPHQPGMPMQENMPMQPSGAEFDRMFLQMMIPHHQTAIDMARTEQARGLNPEAERLARDIETSQQAEIDEMRHLLDAIPR